MGNELNLVKLVGYAEVVKASGVSRSTLERAWRGPWDELEPRLPRPGKIGSRAVWAAAEINKWLEGRAKWQSSSVTSMARTNVDELEPEQLEDRARDLAAQALAKRTGRSVDPVTLALHLVKPLSPQGFAEVETEEHRLRAQYLAQLDRQQAMIVVAVLFPQLREPLQQIADAALRRVLQVGERIEVNFELISGAFTLFDLASRLTEHGMRPSFGETAVERVAEFDEDRSVLIAAWMFPGLRRLFAAIAETQVDAEFFRDVNQAQAAAMAALDDEKWEARQAELWDRRRNSLQ